MNNMRQIQKIQPAFAGLGLINQGCHAIRRQAGVSMVEVLVAMVIFAFGMLGLAGLQSRTLAYGQTSLYRSQATALTDDILDRLRSDRLNAQAGRWNTQLTNDSSSITGTLLYQTDLKDWKKQVEELLPNGQASIVVDTTTFKVTVTLQWDESRGKEQTPTEFATTSNL